MTQNASNICFLLHKINMKLDIFIIVVRKKYDYEKCHVREMCQCLKLMLSRFDGFSVKTLVGPEIVTIIITYAKLYKIKFSAYTLELLK